MDMVTQIGGIKQSKISTLKRALEKQNIAVSELNSEEFMLSKDSKWTPYEVEVAFYESIANSTFHVVSNDNNGLINQSLCLQIMQAVLNQKPVILSSLPNFDDDVDLFTQRIIVGRMHLFAISNLARSHKQEMQAVMRYIKNPRFYYPLNERDTLLIRAKVRNHLQALLVPQTD